jgi:peptidyl-prolyl cis-trans isomerase SurA
LLRKPGTGHFSGVPHRDVETMILRFLHSPAVLLMGTALVATSALSQTNAPAPAPATVMSAPQSGNSGVVVEDIIVRVNDQIVTRSDYQRADQTVQAEAQRNGYDVNVSRQNLLRDLIDKQLLLSKGKELGITGDTELIKQLDEIRKQNHLESMEDLEKAAQTQGVSFEDFKQAQREAIITQSVVREEVGRHLQLSQSDAQKYYQAHKADYSQPESVKLSEILIPTPENADAAQVATAQQQADAIEAKLKGGADFAATAKASSGGPTAAQGGDLGSFRRGALAKPLEDQTFVLNQGQFTAPIRTKQGFVILKVTEHRQAGTPTFEQVESQVDEGAYMEKMQPALRTYLIKLREEAFIDIKPGYTDTGASPNQTKPVYSAYTPPAPKKKKAIARFRPKGSGGSQAALPAATGAAATGAAATDAAGAATSTTATAAKTGSTKAATTASMKPGKKEKIRYGQAPRETLPAAPGETEHVDAGSTPPASQQNPPASQQTAEVNEPANPLTPTAPEPTKSRYSDRAKQPKVKKPKGPQADPFAPPPPTQDETATQKTQAAPLGLAGDTSKKPKKPKPTEKTRYSETAKPKSDETSAPTTAAPTPAPAAAPAQTSPATATPPATAPASTPQ